MPINKYKIFDKFLRLMQNIIIMLIIELNVIISADKHISRMQVNSLNEFEPELFIELNVINIYDFFKNPG